jgi:tetratricopeptide (TPR) repeat protein
MKKAIAIILITSLFISCVSGVKRINYGSGTFRGKWYNYYDRGLALAERSNHEDAASDFIEAISLRERDQRMARTYGMHFIDYFPHRELGIAYLAMGNIERAVTELERSLRDEKSSKAVYYLNKARKESLLEKGLKPEPPSIRIDSPKDGAAVKNFTIAVSGRVTGDGYVAKLSVNSETYRIGLAEKVIEFQKEITVHEDTDRIEVVSEDLLGNVTTYSVPLTVDREGPAISIFDIVEEKSGTHEIVRITGEVNDSTGINRLIIDNKDVQTGGIASYEFNVIADSKTMVLKAYDKLDNVTKAEIDIEKELTAFSEKPAPVLLAFAGKGMFSSDDIPPVITLKDAVDMPAVFVDKYYVEGEVSDNRKVEQILVKGRTVLSKMGRKIFFSKLVKLEEGNNEIDIEAFDSSGNRSEQDFTITRNVPEALRVGNRMSISILPFDIKGRGIDAGLLASDYLTGSFVNQKRFNVMERAKLDQVLLEQKLTIEKLTDPEYSIKVGRLMSSDTILATAVAVDSKSIEFTSRVINTETSEIMEVKDAYSEDRSADSIRQMMDGLASKVAGGFPLVEGVVIKKEKRFVYTDLGSRTGIKGDMGVIIYRKGEEIRHPLTGKYLGQDMKNLGVADIEEIHEDFSKAKLIDTSVDGDIRTTDMVITR